MPLVRKRRAPVADEASDNEQTPTRRRRASPDSEDEVEDGATQENQQLQQMAKKLVRMALACEYARIPIRRTDISAKVLGSQGRQFKNVFNEAQLQLRAVFGMEMTEMPRADNFTYQQRRQAVQRSERQNPTTTNWALTSTLPDKYRRYDMIPPPKVPTFTEESAYTGLYSFVVTCIILGGGELPEAKLDRYLKRTNADQTTPVGPTEKLLARMKKDGYVKMVSKTEGNENVNYWVVAGRGKLEIGQDGAAGMIRAVYANNVPRDLEQRLERSLKLSQIGQATATATATQVDGGTQNGTGRGRGRQRRQQQEDGAPEGTDDE